MRRKSFLLLFLMLGITYFSYSQSEFYNDGATISVDSGALLYIDGELVNTKSGAGDTGVITNNGVIELTGNFTSDTAVFKNDGSGDRTVKFVGSSDQSINGSMTGDSYFHRLEKDNGTNDIILNTDIDVQEVEFKSDGVIDASDGDAVNVKNGDPGAISGHDANRYFDVGDDQGQLSRVVDSAGTYDMPVGNSTAGYRLISFEFTDLGASSGQPIYASVKNGAPGFAPISKYYATGFSGSFPGPCTGGSNSQWVEFDQMESNVNRMSGPGDFEYVVYMRDPGMLVGSFVTQRVLKTSTGTNNWTADFEDVVGGVEANLCAYTDWSGAAAMVPGGEYAGFSDFGIAKGEGTALPVELLYLEATPMENKYIRVHWSTSTEINNSGFELERSTDGVNFDFVQWIPGAGNSTEQVDYSYDDYQVLADQMYYYRLKQVDYDGEVEYTYIVNAMLYGDQFFEVSEFMPSVASGSSALIVSTSDDKQLSNYIV